MRKFISKSALEAVYINSNHSMSEASKLLGCCTTTIFRLLKRYGLKSKARTWNRSRCTDFPELQDKSWLESEIQKKTMAQIARELGTTSGNVSDHVKRYGLRGFYWNRSDAVAAGIRKRFPNGRYGREAANWKGGRQKTSGGHIYKYAPEHPCANRNGYVMEHRLVVERVLGRILEPGEVVHHINGIPDDNRAENLQVMTVSEHRRIHMEALPKLYRAEQRIRYLEGVLRGNYISFDEAEVEK